MTTSSRNLILIDLDDTVSASWRRQHLVDDSWEAFHADLINDEPIWDIVRVLEALSWKVPGSPELIGLTARPEKWRRLTMDWLLRHDVQLDGLLMRPDDDFRPSAQVKVDLVANMVGGVYAIKDRVLCVIDDRDDVLKAFAALGVTTLHINARRA